MRVCPHGSQSWPSHNETGARKGSRKSNSAVDVIEDLEYQSSDTEDSSSRSTCDSGQVCPFFVMFLSQLVHNIVPENLVSALPYLSPIFWPYQPLMIL